jgi:hypothetical protein
MVGRIKLVGLIAALLVISLPSFTLAQDVNFGVSPAEVRIKDLPPGEATEFNLTIHNKDEIAHAFTFTIFQPREEERREGRAEFPDDSWISFFPQEIEVPANSEANVTVTVAIPPEQKWAGQDWETWLGVAAESSDLLGVKLYVRLLVSTNPAVGAKSNVGLFAGIAVAVVLLGYGGYYYFRRKAKPE